MPRLKHDASGVVVNVDDETAKSLKGYKPADDDAKSTSKK